METQWTQAKAVLDQIKESSTKYANRNRQPSQFRVGQQVLVRMFPTNRDQLNAKGPLAKRWAGPYKIVKQITHDSFFLELGDTVGPKFQRVFNAINLKPYWRRIENKPEVIDVDADESETESVVSSQADDFQDVDSDASPFQVDPAETEFQFPDSLPTPLTNQEKWKRYRRDLKISDPNIDSAKGADEQPEYYPHDPYHHFEDRPDPFAWKPSSDEPQSPEFLTPQSAPPDDDWMGDWSSSQLANPPESVPVIEVSSQENDDPMTDWDQTWNEPPPFHNLVSLTESPRHRTHSVAHTHLVASSKSNSSSRHTAKIDVNDVMLDPKIFRQARKELHFKPSVDMFANQNHHQVPRYYTADPHDSKAVGCDAFKYNWLSEMKPYINPPWDVIQKCLAKIKHDQIQAMMVVPEWPSAPWWKQFQQLTTRSITYDTPMYLDNKGVLRPKPKWRTVIAIVDSR
jgi:hypothetical protein